MTPQNDSGNSSDIIAFSCNEHIQTLPTKRMAAGALITRGGEILIVEPTYKENWEIPGGAIEKDESPRDALQRELIEELGSQATIGRPLVIEYQSSTKEKSESVMFIFEVIIPDAAQFAIPNEEIKSFRFVPEEHLDQYLVERLARRLRFALKSLSSDRLIYLENGVML